MGIIRLWKLGDLEHGITPTDDAIKKFEAILKSIPNDNKPFDIVWGPDIQCQLIDDGRDVYLDKPPTL